MPVRGETIGTAYVRILGDGSNLADDIIDDLTDTEDGFRAAGRRDSEAYAEAMEDGFKGPSGRKMKAALTEAIANADLVGNFFNSSQWEKFEASMRYRFGDVGRVAAAELEDEFIKRGSLKGLEDEIRRVTPRIVRATETIVKAEQETSREARQFEEDFRRAMDNIDRDTRTAVRGVNSELAAMQRGIDKTRSAVLSWTHNNEEFTRTLREQQRELRRNSTLLGRTATRFENFAEPMGRLFGRGSRNNFLNFFGSIITNALNFGGVILRVFGMALSAVSAFFGVTNTFIQTFSKQMGQGASMVTAFGAAAAEAFAGLTATTVATAGLNLVALLAALAAAMVAVTLTGGALVSGLVLLGGAIIALAGTIAFSLVAALGVVGPLIIALGAGIGGVVAMVKEFQKENSSLARSFKPVRDSARDLLKTFKDAAFRDSDKTANRLNRALKTLDPLIEAAGNGFRRMFNQFTAGLDTPAFRLFVDAFSEFLPNAMARLGRIAGNSLGGLGGVFRAAIPLAEQFLGWLDKITANFAEFTNSEKGQQKLKSFFEEAGESARAFGDFIGQLTGLIGDLLGAGRDTGDSLFTSMADALERVRNYLAENPDAVRNFFGDAETFARRLGSAVETVVQAIQKIDSPATRAAVLAFIDIFSRIIMVSGTIIGSFAGILSGLVTFVRTAATLLFGFIQSTLDAAAMIPGPWQGAAKKMADSFRTFSAESLNKLDNVESGIDDLESLAKAFNPKLDIDVSGAMAKIDAVGFRIDWLGQQVRNAVSAASSAASGIDSGGNGGAVNGGTGSRRVTTPTPAGRTINVGGITVVSNGADPKTVATETVNRLVAVGY